MSKSKQNSLDSFYLRIGEILDSARLRVYQTANFEMVQAYWNIGRMVFEEEQSGKVRADYGKYLVENLSKWLSSEYGKGFDKTNLWNMIRFYKTFPTLDAVRQELSWTHYHITTPSQRSRENTRDSFNLQLLVRKLPKVEFH